MKRFYVILIFLLFASTIGQAQDTISKKELRKSKANNLLEDRKWTVEVPLWIPGFRGDFSYGNVNVGGGDGVDPGDPADPGDDNSGSIVKEIFSKLFSSDTRLTYYVCAGAKYEHKRFLAQIDAISGGVGYDLKFNYNDKELVELKYSIFNPRLLAGYELYRHKSKSGKFMYKLHGYGGVRIYFNDIYSSLNNGEKSLEIKPVMAHLILGVKNQFILKRWRFVLQADYGGFNIQSRNSVFAQSHIHYRTGGLTSVKFGWDYLMLHHTGEFNENDLSVELILTGPNVGIAFHF